MKKLILTSLVAISLICCTKESEEPIDPALVEDFYRLETSDGTFVLNGDATYDDVVSTVDTMLFISFNGSNNQAFFNLINKGGSVWEPDVFDIFVGSHSQAGQHIAGLSFIVNSNTNYPATDGTVKITSKRKGEYIAGDLTVTLQNLQTGTIRKVSGSFKASAQSRK